jgi:hypothetical protein
MTLRDWIGLSIAVACEVWFCYWCWTVWVDYKFQRIKLKMIQNPIAKPPAPHIGLDV